MQYDCSQVIDENMCDMHVQGYTEIVTAIESMPASDNTDILVALASLQDTADTIVLHTDYITHFLFFAIIFSVVYIIVRWLLKLISDVALGW